MRLDDQTLGQFAVAKNPDAVRRAIGQSLELQLRRIDGIAVIETGIEVAHVPYRSGAQALQDTLAGRHAFQIDTLGSSKGFIDGGRLRILAVCTDQRMAALPEVPTVRELTGFPLEIVTWYLIFAPAGTPQPIVDKLSTSINQAIKAPAITDKARALGMEMVQSTPASSKTFYEDQIARWAPIVRASGAKVE